MNTIRYVSHARSLEELRDEVLSDLQRRLDHWDKHLRQMPNSAAEAARIAKVRQELLDLQDFWKQVELKGNERSSLAQP